MRIGRMISPVHSLGPGERVCLWLQGCPRRCPGCISPELQPEEGPQVSTAALAKILAETARRNGCTGLTVSGGDPFAQPEELERLLALVRGEFQDILVYTGFTLPQLRQAGFDRCLGLIDVLIDGPYIHERNFPDCVLRGSDNQIIHYLNPALTPVYEAYLRQGRVLESFSHNGAVILTGIVNRRDDP